MDELRTILARLYEQYGPTPRSPGPTIPPELPCAHCHGQGWVHTLRPVPGQSLPNYVAVPCEVCVGDESLEERRARMWSLSGLTDEQLAGGTFEAFDLGANPEMGRALEAARRWGAGEGKPFLVLAGNRGLGKTHLAIAAARTAMDRGEACAYLSMPTYMQALRSSQFRPREDGPDLAPPSMEKLIKRAQAYPALIIDDLGMQRVTEFADEQTYLLITGRYDSRRRTLITTMREPRDLESAIASRIQDWQVSTVVRCLGEDYRTRRH